MNFINLLRTYCSFIPNERNFSIAMSSWAYSNDFHQWRKYQKLISEWIIFNPFNVIHSRRTPLLPCRLFIENFDVISMWCNVKFDQPLLILTTFNFLSLQKRYFAPWTTLNQENETEKQRNQYFVYHFQRILARTSQTNSISNQYYYCIVEWSEQESAEKTAQRICAVSACDLFQLILK